VQGRELRSASITGLSPTSVKVREDLAKYKAESEAKSEMLHMSKLFQNDICAANMRTLEVSKEANIQVRSIWDSTESRNARSELMRVQAQAYSHPNPTSVHRDMFFGLGQFSSTSSFDKVGNLMPYTPRQQSFMHQSEPFNHPLWHPGGAQQPSQFLIERQTHTDQQTPQAANVSPSVAPSHIAIEHGFHFSIAPGTCSHIDKTS